MAKCLFSGSSGGLPKSLLEQITAGAGDVLAGKVIVGADGEPLTGTIEIKNGQTITPTPNAQTIACKGKYMTGDIVINGANIYKQYYGWISGSNGSRTYVAADGSSWRKTWRYKTLNISGFKQVLGVCFLGSSFNFHSNGGTDWNVSYGGSMYYGNGSVDIRANYLDIPTNGEQGCLWVYGYSS